MITGFLQCRVISEEILLGMRSGMTVTKLLSSDSSTGTITTNEKSVISLNSLTYKYFSQRTFFILTLIILLDVQLCNNQGVVRKVKTDLGKVSNKHPLHSKSRLKSTILSLKTFLSN